MAFLRSVCSRSCKTANEYVKMANEGKMSVLSMIQEAYVNGHIDYQMPDDSEVVE